MLFCLARPRFRRVKPRWGSVASLGLVGIFWVRDIVLRTAKQSNNKARGREAHPGLAHATTRINPEGVEHVVMLNPVGVVTQNRPTNPEGVAQQSRLGLVGNGDFHKIFE
jgi:hypothetical protein